MPDTHPSLTLNPWRGSLLPLDCAAGPVFRAASRPSGSKLPRHRDQFAADGIQSNR